MFKSPGLIGRVGSGISSLASVLGGAAAAATTYLLQALFGGANQSLANTDVLTDEKGDVTVTDTQTGVNSEVKITSSQLRLTRGAANVEDYDPVVYGPAVTRAAGKMLKFDLGNTDVTKIAGYFGLSNSTATGASAPVECGISSWTSGAIGTPIGSEEYAQSVVVQSNSVLDTFACVVGGWTSGVPDATGTEGGSVYWDNGGTWTLLASSPSGTTSTLYPWFSAETNTNYCLVDNLIIPTAADTSVFTPAGYGYDSFTGSNGTDLDTAGHTANTGEAWTAKSNNAGPLEIQSNRAVIVSGNGDGGSQADFGLSDFFMTATTLVGNTNTSNRSQHYLGYRLIDGANNFSSIILVNHPTLGSRLRLNERVSSSDTLRGEATGLTLVDNTEYTQQVRCSGTKQEIWLDGSNKISYTTATMQTETGIGIELVEIGNTTDPYYDNIYILPLTSATYSTAFDTSALTADDCDLYHTFDSIPDVTFANGAVIRDGYVDDGALTVRDNDANMSVAVTSNKLSCTKTSGGTAAPDIGVYGGAYTRAAGRCIGATYNCSADGVGRNVQIYDSNAGGIPAFADRLYMARAGYTTNGVEFYTFNPAGTVADGFVTSVPVAAGNDLKVRFVQGGFDSAGAPDATGDYGAMMFVHNLTDWELVAASSRGLNTATFYPDFLISESVGGNTTQTLDDIFISETTVESVFTPTGYALDTFTDTNGTVITSHTSDTGNTWSVTGGVASELKIQSNALQKDATSGGATAIAHYNHGITPTDGYFVSIDVEYISSSWPQILLRARDSTTSDHFQVFNNGSLTLLYENNTTSRASVADTLSAGTVYKMHFRDDGNVMEIWWDGAKMSYTSISNNDSACANVGVRVSPSSATALMDNLYVLPLTSATYADLDF